MKEALVYKINKGMFQLFWDWLSNFMNNETYHKTQGAYREGGFCALCHRQIGAVKTGARWECHDCRKNTFSPTK